MIKTRLEDPLVLRVKYIGTFKSENIIKTRTIPTEQKDCKKLHASIHIQISNLLHRSCYYKEDSKSLVYYHQVKEELVLTCVSFIEL